jgi:hypothetical protein
MAVGRLGSAGADGQAGGPLCADGDGGPKLEWSSLSRKSRQAIKRWVGREIGGRHCLMLLEHENAIDFLISPLDPDEVHLADLRGGAMLNALSGFRAEAQGGREGGWLYDAVFAKSPAEVIQEAIQAARSEAITNAGAQQVGSGEDLSLEQLNLALRCLAMNAQSTGMQALLEPQPNRKTSIISGTPRSSEEYMSVQVWLELLRLHSDGVDLDPVQRTSSLPERAATAGGFPGLTGAFGSFAGTTSDQLSMSLRPAQGSEKNTQNSWDDRSVLGELGKPEKELKKDSQKMGLDSLRAQNRSIEAYLMRLVRQRDELRHISRLADECDSYFILGLDGPDASEDEVKKAYRTLARKEHPDKAGTGNKERFQQIQQAYTSVIRQRRYSMASANTSAWSGDAADVAAADGSRSPRNAQPQSQPTTSSSSTSSPTVGGTAREAAGHAHSARECASRASVAAHSAYDLCRQGADAKSMQKRCAVRELCALTRRGTTQLRGSAGHLRQVREYVCAVAQSAKTSLDEYGDWSDTAIAGAGLRERASIAGGAGKSTLATAELLDKICDANEAAVRKAERLSTPSASASETMGSVRLLVKSLARTASVARCAADEAISAATAALELTCSLVALDREWRREKQAKADEQRRQADEPMAAYDGDAASGAKNKDGSDGADKRKPSKESNKDSKDKDKAPDDDDKSSDDEKASEGGKDDPANPQEKARRGHVALRVRNLRCLGGLNDEVLGLQQQLRSLLDRSCGALLPAISLAQKGGVFELVGQILHSGLAEAGIMAGDVSLSARQVLDQSFGFALALEHTRKVALSAEVKTQVLKLAALVDVELLCQIIDGPFKRQLQALGGLRPQTQTNSSIKAQMGATCPAGFAPQLCVGPTRSDSRSGTDKAHSSPDWDKAVTSFCECMQRGLKEPDKTTSQGKNDDKDENSGPAPDRVGVA